MPQTFSTLSNEWQSELESILGHVPEHTDLAIFLEKFGSKLHRENPEIYSRLISEPVIQESEECQYRIKWISVRKAAAPDLEEKVRIQNRRLRFMETVLMPGGDYFSRNAMKEREPILFMEYWGPGATEESIAEFMDLMQQKFLHGQDREFHYELVDDDERLDDRQTEEREHEDRYFDTQEPSSTKTDTGVLDY